MPVASRQAYYLRSLGNENKFSLLSPRLIIKTPAERRNLLSYRLQLIEEP